MSDYLEAKNISKAKGIPHFKCIYVPFKWQQAGYERCESGIFLMMHMVDYEGEQYTCDLVKKGVRRILSVEMAVTLMLADINNAREKLVANAEKFTKEKAGLLKGLLAKRQLTFYANKEASLRVKALQDGKSLIKANKTISTEEPVLRTEPAADIACGKGRGKGRGNV